MANFIELTNLSYSFEDDDEIYNEDSPLPMFVNIDDIVGFWEERTSGTPSTCVVLRNHKTTFYVDESPQGIYNEIRRLQQCNQETI